MFFFFKQKTAYVLRISDWSSDVCSSDLHGLDDALARQALAQEGERVRLQREAQGAIVVDHVLAEAHLRQRHGRLGAAVLDAGGGEQRQRRALLLLTGQALHRPQRLAPRKALKSEEHTSELQSLMRISYAVF